MKPKSDSRYANTPSIMFDSQIGVVETLGSWVSPSFINTQLPDSSIGMYVVNNSEESSPHLISNTLYGTQSYDWILIAFNKVTDVIGWPKAGTVIKYPLPQVIYRELS